MANVNRVYIEGWMPFDITQNDDARSWLGIMNGPAYGLGIEYGKRGRGPDNDHGGFTTYYWFVISGEEALWTAHGMRSVKYLAESLIAGGAVIREARSMDQEGDRENPRWFNLLAEIPLQTPLAISSEVGP